MWLLFAPGAGAPSTSPWMSNWTERLSRFGTVVPFDYPYRLAGRKLPDPKKVLVDHHVAMAKRTIDEHGADGILVGKSLGSRIGLVVGTRVAVRGAICFGYPLVAQNGRTVRREELVEFPGPVLLIQGTRDPLCPLPLLDEVLRQRSGRSELCVVDDGDHSLQMTKTALRKRGLTEDEVFATIAERVATFLDSLAP